MKIIHIKRLITYFLEYNCSKEEFYAKI